MDQSNRFYSLIEKLETAINSLDKRLDSVDKTLVAQHETLKHHIERTKLNEDRIEHIEDITTKKVLPHINRVEGALALIGIVSTIIAIAAGIYGFFV